LSSFWAFCFEQNEAVMIARRGTAAISAPAKPCRARARSEQPWSGASPPCQRSHPEPNKDQRDDEGPPLASWSRGGPPPSIRNAREGDRVGVRSPIAGPARRSRGSEWIRGSARCRCQVEDKHELRPRSTRSAAAAANGSLTRIGEGGPVARDFLAVASTLTTLIGAAIASAGGW